MRLCDLKRKEVINTCTCQSLGCPIDVKFNPSNGCLTALILPGPCKFWGFLGRDNEIVIPWSCICQIGDDIILVKIQEKR